MGTRDLGAYVRTILRSPIAMVLTAFLVRLATIKAAGAITYIAKPGSHKTFGWAVGRIARSVVNGQGFSLSSYTGPTAFSAPAFIWLLAGLFKLFGVYTWGAAVAVLGLNALFSALTCLTVFHIARKAFGDRVAVGSGWLWALSGASLALVGSVTDAALTTLLFTFLFWITMNFGQGPQGLSRWLGYGLLWGALALLNPAPLSLLPFFLVWLWWKHRQRGFDSSLGIGVALLALAVTITPWLVRNYLVFNRFVFLRSAYPLALFAGNNPGSLYPDPTQDRELAKIAAVGELAYMAEYQRAAVGFIKREPITYVRKSLKRVAVWWAGFVWTAKPRGWLGNVGLAFYRFLPPLSFLGMAFAIRKRVDASVPLLAVLLVFPASYYLSEVLDPPRFRLPIEPLITILAVYACTFALEAYKSRKRLIKPVPASESLGV